MRARLFAILILAFLGLMGPVQTIGARSSLVDRSPTQGISTNQALIEDLQVNIPTQMHAAKVPGLSIALIQDGEFSWIEGFGTANTLTGKPVSSDTVFEVASISKPIAAYAALRLVEQGMLSLDEPVDHYLSQAWLPPSAYAEQITLRHLLTHTSGLTNNLNPLDKTITFPPGERYLYSGVGYSYLQEVMEQATGRTLEQIAKELVFEPLQMDSSSYTNAPEILPRLSYGHIQYGAFLPPVVAILAIAFTLSLLLGIALQRLRLGKITLSAKLLWVAYVLAACLTLALVIFILNGEVNKWVTLVAMWLFVFGGGMALALWIGRKWIVRLPDKWQQPQNQAALSVLWSFISALALLLLTNGLSGPVPRSPAGSPGAAYSLRSTAPDLAKFLLELASPQHLDLALMREMTIAQVTVEGAKFWGLGIGLWHGPRGTALWHGGDNADFHALMLVLPEQRNGVVVLSNGQKGGTLVNEVARQAVGMEINR